MQTTDRQNTSDLLRKGKWFGELPVDLQSLILDNTMLRLVEKNQVLIVEDKPPTGMFVVLEGQVAITRQIGDQADFFLHLGGPGFWFGENGMLGDDNAVITATARTKIRALFLPASSFKQIIETEPRYYKSFTKLLLARYSVVIRTLGQSNSLSPEDTLRIRLADLSDMTHSDYMSNEVVELALTQTDLASMIGCSRQTVNMLLKKLESQQLIEVNFRKIRILSPSALRGARRKTGL